jgi:DNA polymerase (family X)
MRAMDHPYFMILSNPAAGLSMRVPYDMDMARIIGHARERGCFLKLNAHPVQLI